MAGAFDKVDTFWHLPDRLDGSRARCCPWRCDRFRVSMASMLWLLDGYFSLSGSNTRANEASCSASWSSRISTISAPAFSAGSDSIRGFHRASSAPVSSASGAPNAPVAAGGVAANQAIRRRVAAGRGEGADDAPSFRSPASAPTMASLSHGPAPSGSALGTVHTHGAPSRARRSLDADAKAPAGYGNTRAGF